ncbi:MAG: glycosyltransferase family 4 protein [Gemmatimonadales bacterium]
MSHTDSLVSARSDTIEVLVNARHLAGPKTGIEVYMEQLLEALGRTGRVRITALTWAPLNLGIPNLREVVPALRPDLAGLRATLWKLWFDQWFSLRAVAPRQAILFHGMEGFLPYSLRSRDRCVVTVHDLGWQAYPELYDKRLRLMYRALFPWVVRRADRFIAVSRYTADDLARRAGIPMARIEVVYHGLDPAFTSPVQSAGRPDTSHPYVLAVGGVSPRKNTRRLIEAFTRWREKRGDRKAYRLLITGLSLDHEYAAGAVLPEAVSLLGYVDKAELPGLYAGASAFLYPAIYEGFGLPIIEAMASGTPVVTSNTGAAPEVAGGAAILVDPFDVQSIAAGLERAIVPEEAGRLRSLGYQRTRFFDWGAAADATLEVYRALLSS